jgi:hypothetical protein
MYICPRADTLVHCIVYAGHSHSVWGAAPNNNWPIRISPIALGMMALHSRFTNHAVL